MEYKYARNQLNILENAIKNKIALQQEYPTNPDFDDGFYQAMDRVLEWIILLKNGEENLL